MPNNLIMVRHRLLTELIKLWKNGKLTSEDIDRLPLKLSPKHSKHAGRCCVHKERAVWKYKALPLMGLNMEDETDELTPLSEYAKMAMDRATNGKPKDEIMCVVDEACSACVQINYEITDSAVAVPPAIVNITVRRELSTSAPRPARHGLTTKPA